MALITDYTVTAQSSGGWIPLMNAWTGTVTRISLTNHGTTDATVAIRLNKPPNIAMVIPPFIVPPAETVTLRLPPLHLQAGVASLDFFASVLTFAIATGSSVSGGAPRQVFIHTPALSDWDTFVSPEGYDISSIIVCNRSSKEVGVSMRLRAGDGSAAYYVFADELIEEGRASRFVSNNFRVPTGWFMDVYTTGSINLITSAVQR